MQSIVIYFVRVPRSNYQTLMKVTFLFWFCYNDESIVLETAVLSDDWGQSLCGWMDIECSNSSVSTTISGDRAASGACKKCHNGDKFFIPANYFFLSKEVKAKRTTVAPFRIKES